MLRVAAISALIGFWSGALLAAAAEPQAAAPATNGAVRQASCTCGDSVCHCRAAPAWDAHARSGYGLWVAPWAVASYGHDYKGYYVGGSMFPWRWARKARPEPRYPWEGTWGTDYAPAYSGVELGWTHGRLHQDGGGQYEPDRRNVPFSLRFGKEETARK